MESTLMFYYFTMVVFLFAQVNYVRPCTTGDVPDVPDVPIYGKRKGKIGGWDGTFNGSDYSYSYLAIIKNVGGSKKDKDVLKLQQYDQMPSNTVLYSQNLACHPVDNVGTCVYSNPESHGLIHDHSVSQILLVFNTFQYVSATANGFKVSLDINCYDNTQNNNWAYLGITDNYSSLNYTMVLTRTGKCHHQYHQSRKIKSIGISVQDRFMKKYQCGEPKGLCDPNNVLFKQDCERVDTFHPVFMDLVKDCGVPPEQLKTSTDLIISPPKC